MFIKSDNIIKVNAFGTSWVRGVMVLDANPATRGQFPANMNKQHPILSYLAFAGWVNKTLIQNGL